jgi:hypothetical protein
MMMRKILLSNFMLLVFFGGAFAQESFDDPPLSRLKSDYGQVGVVARVKVKSVKAVAPDIHPLYLLRGEVVETFKGRFRRGQALEFYLAVEEGFDINSRLGDWLVFLEGSSNTPDKRWGWFALENSSLPYSKRVVSRLRRIKNSKSRRGYKRSLTPHSTGLEIRRVS